MMRGNAILERAVAAAAGVSVRQDFAIERQGATWDPKRVPIVINSFNRLTYLRGLVDSLRARGYENLYVIDNASTYEPLLEYYRQEGLRVFYLDANVGFLAMWATPVGANFVDDYYVYTDPDVEPAPECPDDFMAVFRKGLDRHPRVGKVGFGLRIDDLPDHYALKPRVLEHEQKILALHHGRGRFYRAAIDTTLALYRPGAAGGSWLRALRTSEPYVAKHLPWYEDSAQPDAEERFYLDTVGTSTHWSFRAEGSTPGVLDVPLGGRTVRVAAGRSDDLWNAASRGEWRPETFEFIDRLVDASHSYIEVGGGPGATALYAARVARKVYALEPDPESLEELQRNLALNGEPASAIEVVALAGLAGRVPGSSATFEEFTRAHDLTDCDLVSVDLDGQEWRFIPQIVPFLKRERPVVCVRLSPGRSSGLTTTTAAGKAAIATLGLLSVWRLMWALRFYAHLYDADGVPLTPWRVLHVLSSQITIVASDAPWPEAPALAVR